MKKYINVHTILLTILVLTVASVIFRFYNWGDRVNLDDYADEYTDEYIDNMDMMAPVLDKDGNFLIDACGTDTILCFGNAPFADDRDSKDNLANIIASQTGSTVYNCSVSGSYLAALEPGLHPSDSPMDIFNFYWLVVTAIKADIEKHWKTAFDTLGDDIPPEAQYVHDTLSTLDLNTVDVIAIMYDASDYLEGHGIYSDLNLADIQQFTGNLEAGIELIRQYYPHIRIIVMSPPYAYAVDKSGNYVSSDIYTYGQDVLSVYIFREATICSLQSITFIDNFYGSITEDNADDYLTDNLHLNISGRKLIAERFITALQYYDE